MYTADVCLLSSAAATPAMTKAIRPLFIASGRVLRPQTPSIPLIHLRLQHPPKYQNQLLYP
jgi:hypothetical protein